MRIPATLLCIAATFLPNYSDAFERLPGNPILSIDQHPNLGGNINGPSLIKVPEWVSQPLGKYYLYFAHHGGKYIRLAYVDSLDGPWTVYEPGTLQLSEAQPLAVGHIASPDVHIDEANQRIVMYYHFPVKESSPGNEKAMAHARKYYDQPVRANGILAGQYSGAASSKDGIDFERVGDVIAPYYLRAFVYKGESYCIAKDGVNGGFLMHRTRSRIDQPFEVIKTILPRMRHAAVWLDAKKDRLYVAYSRTGDAPEHILMSWADLNDDPASWEFSEPISLLKPEHDWEGANFRIRPSRVGLSKNGVHELRDPAFYEEDGQLYLLYSIAGESGIAVAKMPVTELRDLAAAHCE